MSAQSHFPKRKAGSFYPPQRTLMGPGPSDIHPRVLSAMGRPTIGYLDPVFVEMMEELKGLLRYAFQTKNALTFPVSGPGSVGMEMCFVNMINPGDKVVVCRNGVFGGRMIENVERCGGTRSWSRTRGARRSTRTRSRTRSRRIPTRRSSPSFTRRPPPGS